MDLTFNSRMEEYYQRFIDLQDKLRRSEEERLKLEVKFNELLQVSREEEQAHYKKLRSQYKRFLDEDRKRQERNEKIIRTLERVETRVNALMSKSERFKLLRRQYQNYLSRLSHVVEPEKLRDMKLDVPPERKTTFDHPSVQKAMQKSTDEKLELLDKYLHSLQSQEVNNDFGYPREPTQTDPSKDLELLEAISDRLNRNFDSNKATSIAEEIMNSIYSRHYKKDGDNEEIGKPYKADDKYDSEDDDYVPKTANGLSRVDNITKPGSVLEHILNKKANLTTYKNPTLEKPAYLKSFNNYNETDNNVSKQATENYFSNPSINKTLFESKPPVNINSENIPTIDSNHKEYNIVKERENDSTNYDTETLKCVVSETSNKSEPNNSVSINQPSTCKINEENINKLNRYTENLQATKETKELPYNVSSPEISQLSNPDNALTKQPHISNASQSIKVEQNMSEKQEVPRQSEDPNQTLDNQHFNELEQAANPENAVALKESKIEQPVEIDYSMQQDEQLQPIEPSNISSNQQFNIAPSTQEYINTQQFNDIQPTELVDDQTAQDYGDHQHTSEQYDETRQEYNQNVQPTDEYAEQGQPVQYQEETTPQYYQENNQPLEYQQHYDENGQPIPQYDEHDQAIPQYDEHGQPVQYDANGQPIQPYNYQYDENSQLQYQQQYDEQGQAIQQYDENGQLIQQYQPQYDENVQLVQQFDEHGQPIHYQPQYDETGQPVPQQYDEHGQVIQQQYDEHGQLIQQYDENGQPIQQYEQTQQPIQVQYDENGQPIQTYDDSGQVYQNYEQVNQQFEENAQMYQPAGEQVPVQQDHFGEEVSGEQHEKENRTKEPGDKKNVLEILDTDTESTKQNTSKISNDSDFDFSNG